METLFPLQKLHFDASFIKLPSKREFLFINGADDNQRNRLSNTNTILCSLSELSDTRFIDFAGNIPIGKITENSKRYQKKKRRHIRNFPIKTISTVKCLLLYFSAPRRRPVSPVRIMPLCIPYIPYRVDLGSTLFIGGTPAWIEPNQRTVLRLRITFGNQLARLEVACEKLIGWSRSQN